MNVKNNKKKKKKALSMVSCDIVCCDTVVGIMPCHAMKVIESV